MSEFESFPFDDDALSLSDFLNGIDNAHDREDAGLEADFAQECYGPEDPFDY